MPGSSWSASSQVIRRIARASRSSVRPDGSSDRAVDEAGLDRRTMYLTNAVKHFRFRQTGPGSGVSTRSRAVAHVVACRPWLDAELDLVDPEITVVLGATAARAIIGSGFRVTKQRGHVLEVAGPDGRESVLATVHPSSVLRARDDRDAAFAGLVADLAVVPPPSAPKRPAVINEALPSVAGVTHRGQNFLDHRDGELVQRPDLARRPARPRMRSSSSAGRRLRMIDSATPRRPITTRASAGSQERLVSSSTSSLHSGQSSATIANTRPNTSETTSSS